MTALVLAPFAAMVASLITWLPRMWRDDRADDPRDMSLLDFCHQQADRIAHEEAATIDAEWAAWDGVES